MKKFLFLLLTTYYLLHTTHAFAVTTTPTPKVSPTVKPTTAATTMPLDKQIDQLKDRIASRVAELKLVERRGIMGVVTDVSDTQITITDMQDATRFIDVDEITKFSSPSAKGTFGISDINKGTRVGALGLFNKQSKRLQARFIDVIITPIAIIGAVVSTDSENFTVTVVDEKGKQTIVDIESTTKTSSYNKEGGVVKSGFSKIQSGERILAVGFPNLKDKKHLVGSRIIHFPTLPKNPKIQAMQPAIAPQETPPPSTGSGKKLQPITR